MILGVTAFLCAGKGEFSNYLKEKDFIVYSCSDIIREECKKRNIETTRDNLQKIGNELREQFGANVLAERLAQKIKNSNKKYFVVESIRSPAEIEELKKLNDFYLVFIDADSKIRYQRAKERLREKEHVSSYEEFITCENKEMESSNPNSQQLKKCKELSEYIVSNDTTIEEFKKEIDNLLLKIQLDYRTRPSWDQYFMNIAKQISLRSTCLCVNIGSIITINNRIVSTGYVGAPRNTKDCYQRKYCIRRKLNVPSGQQYELCASVHAEQNAIINAARSGAKIKDGTMYIYGERSYQNIIKPLNAFPCYICKKMIINSGIKKVVCSTKENTIKVFDVQEWIDDWKINDIVEDKEKYDTKYK
jgi:dCMP deaminase